MCAAAINHGRVAPCAPATARSKLAITESVLQRHFGHSSLRPFQKEALAAWAAGVDAIVTMATGAGKSLCFQLPPLCEPPGRWALIISPLVALMQDQVQTLRQRQIPAALCGSGAQGASAASWAALEAGSFRVVYMCPEFAMHHLAQLASLRDRICLLAIDEAHCVSSWGHDFRPQYRELGRLRASLESVPVLCVTATCAPRVREDIEHSLGLGKNGNARIARIAGPLNRSNLKYIVRPRTTMQKDFGDMFGIALGGDAEARRAMPIDNSQVGPTASTIIYVGTKVRTEEVTEWLVAHGINASAYHAGIGMAARRAVHLAFVMDEVQVVVATIAFGMGIDKPSIRRVIHYGPVQSLEHYVQQCGRAGRDGEEAECVAFSNPERDANESRQLILQDFARQQSKTTHCERLLALNADLIDYMSDSQNCRRSRLLKHFGEAPKSWAPTGSQPEPPCGECVLLSPSTGGNSVVARCSFCDVCLDNTGRADGANNDRTNQDDNDFTRECSVLLRCVQACGGLTGAKLPVSMAAGHVTPQIRAKKLERHTAFGKGSDRPLQWWESFLRHVQRAGFLQQKPAKLANGMAYAAVSLTPQGSALLAGIERGNAASPGFVLNPVPADIANKLAPQQTAGPNTAPTVMTVRSSATDVVPTTADLLKRLVHVRLQWMRRHGVFGEAILPNHVLKRFAEIRPSSVETARQQVEGLPGALAEDLLLALLEAVRTYCSQTGFVMDVLACEASRGEKRPPALSDDVVPKVARSSVAGTSNLVRSRSKALGSSSGELDLSVEQGPSVWLGKASSQAHVRAQVAAQHAPELLDNGSTLSALDAFAYSGTSAMSTKQEPVHRTASSRVLPWNAGVAEAQPLAASSHSDAARYRVLPRNASAAEAEPLDASPPPETTESAMQAVTSEPFKGATSALATELVTTTRTVPQMEVILAHKTDAVSAVAAEVFDESEPTNLAEALTQLRKAKLRISELETMVNNLSAHVRGGEAEPKPDEYDVVPTQGAEFEDARSNACRSLVVATGEETLVASVIDGQQNAGAVEDEDAWLAMLDL